MHYCATAYQKKVATSQCPDVLTGANKPANRGMNPLFVGIQVTENNNNKKDNHNAIRE
jgi:hypothetical protein